MNTPSLVEAAVRERVRQYEAAYNAGDADAVAAIYAVDGTHTYALGFTHRSRQEIADGLRECFAGPFAGTRITINPLHIRALSSDVAVEEASFSLAGLKDPGGRDLPPVAGICLGVYQKQGDRWFAAAVQCMVPPPAPGPTWTVNTRQLDGNARATAGRNRGAGRGQLGVRVIIARCPVRSQFNY